MLSLLIVLSLVTPAFAQYQAVPKEPPPKLAPGSIRPGDWHAWFETQEMHGKETTLRGHPAEIEDGRLLFRADEIIYDQDTGDVHATGHVYYRNFLKNEQIWADRVDYNTEEEKGKFYEVKGETHPRIVTRPGVLKVDSPFHFEGQWAEYIDGRYILYNGWVTNCRLPKPWWRLRGPKFDIEPDERALAYRSIFLLRWMPLFYAPVFYHSLHKEPRKSGFLIPNLVPHSQRGFMVGLGYFWAINRSYDATYRIQDFTTQAFAHHLDFRGNPKPGTEFNAIVYAVQDRGIVGGTNPPTYSGASIYLVGKSDLGDGWSARGYVNYITSFRFRQEWSESYNEAIGSEIHSIGYVNKDWSTYSFDVLFARLENFESVEIPYTDPKTGQNSFLSNAVLIRKMPEAELSSRDRKLWNNLPLWLSFDSAAGLLYRSEPFFSGNTLIDRFETGQFTNRLNLSPHLTSAIHLGDFHLVPRIGIQETFYSESQEPDPANPGIYRVVGTDVVRSAREFSLDFIPPSLERVYQKKTIFGDKLKHVIEPRVTYRYVTGVGSDFNRFIRFDNTDLLSNTNEVEISLTNRIYAKRGDTVQEIFTWQLFEKRYFDPTFGGALVSGERNVFATTSDLSAYAFVAGPRSYSPVVSLLRMSPVPGLGVQWQTDYDPLYRGIVDNSLSVDYHWKKYSISAANNSVHETPALQTPAADQFRFGVGFGDANRRGWNAGAVAVYDYRKAIIQYSTSQVTYNTDCCGISVQYRRYNIGLRDESQFRIAFAIGNVGSFGTLRKQDRLF